jgi:hypothetical protein
MQICSFKVKPYVDNRNLLPSLWRVHGHPPFSWSGDVNCHVASLLEVTVEASESAGPV